VIPLRGTVGDRLFRPARRDTSSETTGPGQPLAFVVGELPAYIADEGRPPAHADRLTAREVWGRVRALATALVDAPVGATPMPGTPSGSASTPWPASAGPQRSGQFRLLIELPGPRLPEALEAWWRQEARGGAVTIEGRLRLSRPRGTPGGMWTMEGRLRRPRPWPWAPVRVELWPHLERWAICTLLPVRRTHASRAYFRAGHRALDQMSARLAGGGDL
jgi:hypothetical protein